MSEAMQRRGTWLCVAVAVVALIELAAHASIERRVVTEAEWSHAIALIRDQFQPGDRLVVAPAWASPVVRMLAPDMTHLADVAAQDDVDVRRFWELSIRDARSKKRIAAEPNFEKRLGPVIVRRFDRVAQTPLYDFVSHVEDAEVHLVEGGTPRICEWQELPRGKGGIGAGPLAPRGRFVCDRRRDWLWVGETITTDLALQPRRCIWQHPHGTEPVRVRFDGVPVGDAAVIHAGIYYDNERKRANAPVGIRVLAGDRVLGDFVHRDGDGWARYDIDTTGLASPLDITVETRATDPHARSLCWAGYTLPRAP